MSVAERGKFPGASRSCRHGRITGHLNTRTYRPPSRSAAYTYEVAGRAGFGLAIDTACHDLDGQDVTTLRMVPVASSPKGIESILPSRSGAPTVFRFHDRDVVEDPDFLVHILRSVSDQDPALTYLSADELDGYLHARWTIRPGPENSLMATADFSSPECRYLDDHESSWTLLATDEVLAALSGTASHIVVREDSGANLALASISEQDKPIQLRVPAGARQHTLTLQTTASSDVGADLHPGPSMTSRMGGSG